MSTSTNPTRSRRLVLLKRPTGADGSSPGPDGECDGPESQDGNGGPNILSLEEREMAYEEARRRIFGQSQPVSSSLSQQQDKCESDGGSGSGSGQQPPREMSQHSSGSSASSIAGPPPYNPPMMVVPCGPPPAEMMPAHFWAPSGPTYRSPPPPLHPPPGAGFREGFAVPPEEFVPMSTEAPVSTAAAFINSAHIAEQIYGGDLMHPPPQFMPPPPPTHNIPFPPNNYHFPVNTSCRRGGRGAAAAIADSIMFPGGPSAAPLRAPPPGPQCYRMPLRQSYPSVAYQYPPPTGSPPGASRGGGRYRGCGRRGGGRGGGTGYSVGTAVGVPSGSNSVSPHEDPDFLRSRNFQKTFDKHSLSQPVDPRSDYAPVRTYESDFPPLESLQ